MDTTGTDFYAHQFKPVVKLLNSAGRGILIADEVGLGKTIEAGLLWTELRTRFDFRRLLVLCPAVLREKWQRELRNRFGVHAEVLDAQATLTRLQRAAEEGHAAGFAIVASLQGLRPGRGWREQDGEETRRAPSRLARFLDDHSQAAPLVDLCVIDEAHYLRNRETMTSALGRLVRAVSDYLVLLSATPIHLKSTDLYELLNLVDEDTFERRQAFDEILEANGPLVRARELILGGSLAANSAAQATVEEELVRASDHPLLAGSQQLRALIDEEVWRSDLARPDVVARLAERLDRVNLLGHAVTRTRKRDVEERRVIREVEAQEVELAPAEAEFYEAVTRVVREYCMKRDSHEGFLLVTPQRQMCSSMPAALRSWLQGGTVADDDDREDRDGADHPLRAELVASAGELGDLDTLCRNDRKYAELRERLRSLFRRDRDEKVIIFSYFRPTLAYLHERLREDDIASAVLHGGVADKDETVGRFRDSPDNVLLSSEVGSEGIDLQFARLVINYDLPWNPMRVEQRIGRIDRLGQRAEKIHVWNMFYKDTIDGRIHRRLFERLGIFEGALGALEPVLGDTIQQLTRDLFSKHLTPDQEDARIEQTRQALEIRARHEEELEREAAHLTAYGDYILNQVRAARDLHRTISAQDIRTYVTDHFDVHYGGSQFRQLADDSARFDVDLSSEARDDLARYLKKQSLEASTRLAGDTVRTVRCRFENSAVPDLHGREEVISQFHPLVRFVSERLEDPEEQRRPAVAIRLRTEDLDFDVVRGRYAFSVQRWSVQGLRDMERLCYAAAPLGARSTALGSQQAERLVVAAASRGAEWLGVRAAVALDEVVDNIEERCIAASERAFDTYVADVRAENDDRADVQERMLDRHYRIQRASLEAQLEKYLMQRKDRLVPATRGRVRALEARVGRRRREIGERRRLRYSSEIVCVGIIDIYAG